MAFISRFGIGDTATVAATIQKVEGWFPGSISYRNNNPGNLRPAGQPGCTSVSTASGNFCLFPSYDAGYQALVNQLNLDASRGLTIAQEMQKYAPASDSNDPASYAATIASATGLSINDTLSAALGGSTDPTLTDPTATDPTADPTASGTIDLFGTPVDTTTAVIGGIALVAMAYMALR